MLDAQRANPLNRDRIFIGALAALAAIYVALFFYFVERASIRVPVYDLLDWLNAYADRLPAGDWPAYLWMPHNEHRIVLSRILLAADVKWFGGGGTAFAFSGFMLLAVTTGAILREIVKADLSTSWKATACLIVVLLLTPANIAVTIGMPAMTVFLQTCAFAVFSLVLLDGAGEENRFSHYRRVAAFAAACVAAFGVSTGLLIWPVLIWTAWRGGLGRRAVVLMACAAFLFAALYLWRLPLPLAPASFDADRLVRGIDYAIRFLGLPWSHVSQLVWPARLVGIAILCFGVFLGVKESFAREPVARLPRIGAALVLFALLAAAAAALARADLAEDREMPVRYSMFVVLAHVGFLLYALPYLQKFWQGSRKAALQWLIAALFVTWVGQQYVTGRFAAQVADRYNASWSLFAAGEWRPDMEQYIYPDRGRARAILMHLRALQIPHIE